MKIKLTIFAISILVIIFSYVLGFFGKKEPIVVGFMGPLTGKYSDLGVYGRNGAMLAIEEINAEGGVNGHPLVLKAEDDFGTPEGTKEAFNRLKDAGVVAIVGPMLSINAFALKPLIDEARIVAISPTISSSYLSGEKDYFFRVITDNTIRAHGLAKFALEIVPSPARSPKLWCFIYDMDNVIYTEDFIRNFSKVIENAGDITACRMAYSNTKNLDLGVTLNRIKVLRPDAVVLVLPAIDGALVLNWLDSNLPGTYVFGASWMVTGELFRRLHNEQHATIFVEHLEPPEYSERALIFKERFEKRYGKPLSFPAIYSYCATRILSEALIKAGGKAGDLQGILSSGLSSGCIIGETKIDTFGDAHHPLWIYKIERGRLKFIKEERF